MDFNFTEEQMMLKETARQFGVVGDLFDVVPALTEEVKKYL